MSLTNRLIHQISKEDIVVVEINNGNIDFIAEDTNKIENILHFA